MSKILLSQLFSETDDKNETIQRIFTEVSAKLKISVESLQEINWNNFEQIVLNGEKQKSQYSIFSTQYSKKP